MRFVPQLKHFFFFFYIYLSVSDLSGVVGLCGVFCCGAWPPELVDSVVAAHGLSCSEARRILVSWPGIEPASPALQGRFVATGPPGSPSGIVGRACLSFCLAGPYLTEGFFFLITQIEECLSGVWIYLYWLDIKFLGHNFLPLKTQWTMFFCYLVFNVAESLKATLVLITFLIKPFLPWCW